MAARQLGVTTDIAKVLSACVGGNLDRHAQVSK
jgi:hypothetical protein